MADWGLLVENYYKNHRRWNSTRIDKLILEVLGEVDSLAEASVQGLSLAVLTKYDWRRKLFIDKVKNKLPFQDKKGGEVIIPEKGNEEALKIIANSSTEEILALKKIILTTADGRTIQTGTLAKTQEFVTQTGADGEKIKNPNRGELAEAWMALAVTKRFLNLPSTAKVDKDGAVIEPAKGMVKPDEVIEFLESGQVKRVEGENATIRFSGKAGLDTINMEVGLRGYSMDGLLDPQTGKVGEFALKDQKSVAYLKASCEYANSEVVKWAIGVAQNGSGEKDPSKAMGWFINRFENTINIRGVGTAAQSLTKVDMEMTCQGEGCPETMVKGGVGAAGKQLARLSLKAGEVAHFGGGAATSVEKSIGIMESVFAGGQSVPEAEAWAKKHIEADTFSLEKFKANKEGMKKIRAEALNNLVEIYGSFVKKKMSSLGTVEGDAKFLEDMIEGLLQHSVKGKDSGVEGGPDFSQEAGVILVQTTDQGDFYTLDFNMLPGVLGDGADFEAELIPTGGGVNYLTIYQSKTETETGEKKELPAPTSLKAPNILFWIRTLARTGAEILRLEKGALMKKVIGVKKSQKLVYRDGKVVPVPDENK